MWYLEISCTQVCVSPSSSNKQLPSIQLQHSRLTKRLTFRNCPALISMSIWPPFLSRLISPKNAVGNIITLLHSLRRSEGAYRAAYECLKARHQTVFVVSTAKAYFPDRQSCSTLCRQPFGCARSVEVVAVYPSLGSYSVVGLFWWASPPFRRLLILPSIMYGVVKRVFQGSNQYFVDLHKTGTWFLCTTTSWLLTPPLIPTGRGHFWILIGKLFYFCSFAQILCSVFVQFFV